MAKIRHQKFYQSYWAISGAMSHVDQVARNIKFAKQTLIGSTQGKLLTTL